MSLWLQDADVTLYHGDALGVLSKLPAESVDCVVTSPPYWGLRDYGTGAWDGGDAGCDHKARARMSPTSQIGRSRGKDARLLPDAPSANVGVDPYGDTCGKCGATRIDQQLGLEPTPEQYVERMVEVFREVRRVLAAHGTVWLNLGDSYASGEIGRNDAARSLRDHRDDSRKAQAEAQAPRSERRTGRPAGLKPKDLVGIPWRVAFALQADGWYLRSDIIWSKDNPMPESVTDRPTKSHEYVFLLSKNPRYYFDQEAVREKAEWNRWGAQKYSAEAEAIYGQRIKARSRKEVLAMYGGTPADGVLSAAEQGQLLVGVQDLCKGTSGEVEDHSNGTGQDERGKSSLRTDGEGPAGAAGGADLRDTTHSDAGVSQELRGPRGSTSSEHVGGGSSANTPLLPEREGQGSDAPQAASPATLEGSGSNADERGVDGDQDAVSASVRLLPSEAGTDPGSRHSVEQRREPHEGERGPGVSELQRTEGRQAGRNIRSVWQIATQPYPEAHFATFPEELARRAIAAGCPEQVCEDCGRPRTKVESRHGSSTVSGMREATGEGSAEVLLTHLRESEDRPRTPEYAGIRDVTEGLQAPTTAGASDGESRGLRDGAPLSDGREFGAGADGVGGGASHQQGEGGQPHREPSANGETTPRQDGEAAAQADPLPSLRGSGSSASSCSETCSGAFRLGVVLDPFVGSGTVAYVARKLGRHSIGIDLSADYLALAARRLQQQSLFAEAAS